MLTAVQYYRAPFPEAHRWADDLSAIRDTGIEAIQLWCLWGWIEGKQGTFRYDDYDRLIQLAGDRGLGVILSTVAEIHPFWIHRAVPGANLVDGMNRPVVSCPRAEVNVGLSPGGCYDHPEIARRMRAFLVDLAGRYASAGNLLAWDCWNETRWNVHAETLTCYCQHTLAAFRAWLADRYGDLEGLSDAWKRRYDSWDDVIPSKRTAGPFSDLLDWGRFHGWRARRHARWRYEAIRQADGDPNHPITAHGPMPTLVCPPVAAEVPFCRANDWDLADVLDGVGSSHFPYLQGMGDSTIAARMQQVVSSAQGKLAWVSEIQGSSSPAGYGDDRRPAGDPLCQQRWLLDAASRGYDAMIFWAWRNEVFCRESGSHGMFGRDEVALRRMGGLKAATDALSRHADLLADYRPDPARVGVLFVPDNYTLTWAWQGNIDDARWSVMGYARALERLGVAYEFVESDHTDILEQIDVLFAPWCQLLPESARNAIEAFVDRGGVLLTEAETDAFSETGFYRYTDERPLMQHIGAAEVGRESLSDTGPLRLEIDGESFEIPLKHFAAPFPTDAGKPLARDAAGRALILAKPVGQGSVVLLGSFAGRPYYDQRNEGFEALLAHVCSLRGVQGPDLGIAPPGDSHVYFRFGRSGENRLLWLFNQNRDLDVDLSVPVGQARSVRELLSDQDIQIPAGQDRCAIHLDASGSAILCWDAGRGSSG